MGCWWWDARAGNSRELQASRPLLHWIGCRCCCCRASSRFLAAQFARNSLNCARRRGKRRRRRRLLACVRCLPFARWPTEMRSLIGSGACGWLGENGCLRGLELAGWRAGDEVWQQPPVVAYCSRSGGDDGGGGSSVRGASKRTPPAPQQVGWQRDAAKGGLEVKGASDWNIRRFGDLAIRWFQDSATRREKQRRRLTRRRRIRWLAH